MKRDTKMTIGRSFGAGALLLATVLGFGSEPSAIVEIVATYTPYSEARPILESLRKDLAPQELNASPDVESTWPGWIARRNAAIRARVMAGDDESVVNLLLFGTT